MKYQFSEIIDVPSLQDLMNSLYQITGIPVAVFDQDGFPLLSSGWPEICELCQRLCPEHPRRCFPPNAFAGAPDCHPVDEGWVEFRCQNGLASFGFQVRVEGQHLTTLLVGPLLHEPADPAIFIARAAELGIQKDEYLGLVDDVSVIAHEKIESSLNFYSSLVKILTGDCPAILGQVRDLTERTKSKIELHESQATLKSILMAAPMSAGLVCKRVMTLVNRWMIDELGYTEGELVGRSARMLYESTAEFDRVGRELYGQISQEVVGETQTRFKCKNGKMIDVLLRWVPIDPENFDAGIIFTVANISEVIRVEKVLRNVLDATETAHNQLNAILNSVTAGLIVVNPDGLTLMANPTAEVLLGLKASKMVGVPVAEIIVEPEFLERIRLALEGVEKSAPIQLALDKAQEAKKRFLQIKVASLKDTPDDVRGAVAILHDVTREHEINQMKDEFISTAAHELRTPMTSILGYTELMLENTEQFEIGQLKEFLQIIFDRSKALIQIVSDMLDLSRVQSGKLILLEQFPGDLVALVQQILPSYKYNDNRCKIIIDADKGLPPVLFDPHKMTQVFDNLISNAVKFSPDGGSINVILQATPDEFVVTIKDQGLGMSPEQLEQVFDKFYRVDSSNIAVSGLGLGMSLVKSIIEGHGGRIWIESEVGVGTVAHFTLPRLLQNDGKLT